MDRSLPAFKARLAAADLRAIERASACSDLGILSEVAQDWRKDLASLATSALSEESIGLLRMHWELRLAIYEARIQELGCGAESRLSEEQIPPARPLPTPLYLLEVASA